MRVPIQYALTHPDRTDAGFGTFDLAGRSLTFETPDRRAFPALDLAYDAGRRGGTAPAVLNAADEVAVQAFLEGRLGFMGIPEVLERTLNTVESVAVQTVDGVLEADREARAVAHSLLGGAC
jgi:1-deoxy-D-xylulose-5-phosphate reductoisomerase